MPDQVKTDPGADFVFTSRSAGNTPEKIQAALESEGIFVTSTSEISDEVVTAPAPKEEIPASSEPAVDAGKKDEPAIAGDTADPAKVDDKEEPTAAATEKKPGVKERLKAKVATAEAALQEERTKRESLARELEDYKAGKRAPSLEPPVTDATTVVKTEEKPAEPAPRPKRPKEGDFWEAEDPSAAHAAADEKYEDDLLAWHHGETQRKEREAEATKRQQEATESFKAINEADQQARSERWKTQREEALTAHPDFDDKLKAAKPFSAAMIEGAHASEYTAEIGYYLATNPEEAERIFKATDLPKNPTQSQINKAMRKVTEEYLKIEAKLELADDADDEPAATQVTEPPVADPAKPVAAAPAAEPAVPAKKFTPVTPVGGRGGVAQKSITELAKSSDKDDMQALRDMPLDEYRRRKAG